MQRRKDKGKTMDKSRKAWVSTLALIEYTFTDMDAKCFHIPHRLKSIERRTSLSLIWRYTVPRAKKWFCIFIPH
jgi:hypothetical protein